MRGQAPIRYSKPDAGDAAGIWALARTSSALDLNSPYFYLIFAQHFTDTSIVAKDGGELAGFIAGMRPPHAPDTLFVWQIGVADAYRRQGIAHEMLRELLERLAVDGTRYLDATVTPSNEASQRMFRTFAEQLGAPCEETLAYPAALFPAGEEHEEERLLHIGPFTAPALRRQARELVEQKKG